MVVFSSVALLAFVAPHCAVPSVPWSQHSNEIRSPANGPPGEWWQIGCPDFDAAWHAAPTGPGPEPPTLPGQESGGQCSAEEWTAQWSADGSADVTSSVRTPWQSLGWRKVIREPIEPIRGSS
ncbi:hypothetical protein GCM10010272_50690 [Streptomyces lateritius]|nr:hypothetical protein GCM10010272_50690 [Streptomyces lateritius]